MRRAPRRGTPWWAPLLALVLLTGALAGGIVAARDNGADPRAAARGTFRPRPVAKQTTTAAASPATTTEAATTAPAETAPAPTTTQAAAPAGGHARLTARGEPVPADASLRDLIGRRAQARRVVVTEPVGRKTFWVATAGGGRVLVHYQGYGTFRAIRKGQRLWFDAVVKKTRRGAPGGWGVSAREGRSLLRRQGAHLETYGPSIAF